MPRSRPGKRKEQAAATRKKLYDVSIRLIEKHGFENVTVESICRAAGVAVGSFYTHFPSKAGIIGEIYRQGDEHFENVVAGALKEIRSSDRILEFFRYYAEFNAGNGIEFVRLLYRGLSRQFIDRNRFMFQLLQRIVEEGQALGEIRTDTDSAEIADFLFVFVRGILYDWCLHEGDYDVRPIMDARLRVVLPAILG